MLENKEQPRILLTDNDAAYSVSFFQQVLDDKEIVLNMNTVGDHHALGIIDNFAKRLKFIFSKKFIKNKNTRWINKLDGVINIYNNVAHSSLGGLTPNEATKDEHIAKLVEINRVKRKYNKTVSDLEAGDKVRKLITTVFTKGTDPRFTDEVYTVVRTSGKKVILDDDTTNLRYNLLQVPNDTISTDTNVKTQIKLK